MWVNENELWTQELNMLNQLRLTYDFPLGRRSSIFIGPTLNLMLSRVYDGDTQKIGSSIVLYNLTQALIDGDDATKISTWIGINAGFRF